MAGIIGADALRRNGGVVVRPLVCGRAVSVTRRRQGFRKAIRIGISLKGSRRGIEHAAVAFTGRVRALGFDSRRHSAYMAAVVGAGEGRLRAGITRPAPIRFAPGMPQRR